MPVTSPTSKVRARAIALGYRSGLEESVASQLTRAGIPFVYEDKAQRIPYTTPPTPHKYLPDFRLPNGIIIETKGRFTSEDRAKHELIKAQHPELDIRFVFNRSKSKLDTGSPTTYAMWCEKRGFKFADKLIPQSWLDGPPKESL